MTKAEKIIDLQKRLKIVQSWEKRLKKLKEKKGIKQISFCRKHGIDASFLTRSKKLTQIPMWDNVNLVEKALKSEGV